ncbi:ATP-binding protein [Algoriphagus halophytocola]|uniref:histidine kinase n=1 Tax=Algoriphagus halophytocola TaxID=2991499 RepID=A0ABY6MKE3_9BACT|nr:MULTISPECIES: ATP-binding protein [unclassified Algoriphagus]UZD23560.1 ATP-binding protein [Algoriphagus sp. TR-M5]WBL44854.1 ATP-binding protein [Algoriphagus sp. TR-M9]
MLNESQRYSLIEKYNLVDSPHELTYDRITEEIARQFDAYGATISIFSQAKVWFKSRYGIYVDHISPEHSLALEMAENQLPYLVIEDFSKNEQYKNHYLHNTLGNKFFVSVPIVLENEIMVGGLCVFDSKPHQLSEKQLEYLKSTAKKVGELFCQTEGPFKDLTQITPYETGIIQKVSSINDFGGFHLNTSSNELIWNPVNNQLLKLKVGWSPRFNDLINPTFSKQLKANKDVFKLMIDLQALISNDKLTQHARLYTLEFALQKPLHLNVIYQRNGDHIHVLFKNESRFLELAHQDSKNKSFLKEVESISKIGGWEFDLESSGFRFSKNAAKILDIASKPTASLESLDMEHKVKDFQALKNGFRNSVLNKTEYSGDHNFKLPGQPNKILRVQGKPIFIDSTCNRIVGTIQDITEDKAQLELVSILKTNVEKQVSFYKSLINNNNIYILQLQPEGKLIFSNKHYNQVFAKGKSEEELFGQNELESYSAKNRSKIKSIISRCLEAPGTSFSLYLDRVDSKGEHKLTQWDCCTIGSEDAKQDILLIGIDITQLKKSKEKLEQLVEKIYQQQERSLEFGKIVNHNVRSQVANLQGLIQLMDLMQTPEEKMEYFNHLETTVNNLNNITNIVSLVLAIQNNFNYEKTTIHLEDLVDEILSDFWKEMIQHAIQIDLDIPEGFTLTTNKDYLEIILQELINNAIKFRNPAKKLKLSIRAKRTENQSVIEVRDNGIGIDLNLYKNRIFKLYDTLSPSTNFKGTGLYLSKVRINSMGGTIRLASKPMEGTAVFIELPDEEN